MIRHTLYPDPENQGERIDVYLSRQIPTLTRSAIQKLILEGKVFSQKQVLKKNYRIVGDETLEITIPDPKNRSIIPQDIAIDILYEDQDIVVINKARGMVVHPAAGNWDGTLVNALMYHCGDRLSGINGELRPGIVHRIDKDTSGLLVVAKNDLAHQHLASQIAKHEVKREYEAIVCGSIRLEHGTIDRPIGRHKTDRKKMAIVSDGRTAITHYQVLQRFQGYTHVEFRLETGRTHQIRVHMASIGHPIIGDPLYGHSKDAYQKINGQCLHAIRLTFIHPTNHTKMYFTAPRPQYFDQILYSLSINSQ